MDTAKNISNKITYLNWLMAVLMVLYHLNPYSRFNFQRDLPYDLFCKLVDILGSLSLGYFFMMSGFLLYYKSTESKAVTRKLKGRVTSLLLPFLTWNVIGLFFRIVMDQKCPFTNVDELIRGFSFFPFDGPLWYMFCLILIIPLFPILARIHHKVLHMLILIALTVLSIYCCAEMGKQHDGSLTEWFLRLGNYLPLYYIGLYMGLFHGNEIFSGRYQNQGYYILGGVISLLSFVILIEFQQYFVLKKLAFIALPVAIWLLFPIRLCFKKPSFLFKLSFLIYASHIMLLALLEAISYKLVGCIVLESWGVIITKFTITGVLVLIVYFTAKLMKRYMTSSIFSVFTGGRI